MKSGFEGGFTEKGPEKKDISDLERISAELKRRNEILQQSEPEDIEETIAVDADFGSTDLKPAIDKVLNRHKRES